MQNHRTLAKDRALAMSSEVVVMAQAQVLLREAASSNPDVSPDRPEFDRMMHEIGVSMNRPQIHFVPPAFAGPDGRYAASLPPRFAPIGSAIGLAREAQIHSRLASTASRDPVKYPG